MRDEDAPRPGLRDPTARHCLAVGSAVGEFPEPGSLSRGASGFAVIGVGQSDKKRSPMLRGRWPTPHLPNPHPQSPHHSQKSPRKSTCSSTDSPYWYRHSSRVSATTNSKNEPLSLKAMPIGAWCQPPSHRLRSPEGRWLATALRTLPSGADGLALRVFQINLTDRTSERQESVEKYPDVTGGSSGSPWSSLVVAGVSVATACLLNKLPISWVKFEWISPPRQLFFFFLALLNPLNQCSHGEFFFTACWKRKIFLPAYFLL